MKVKELAANLNTTADTVRYYARLGLVHPKKSDNGYKFFSNADKTRLQFILNARSLGFSVSDIKEILKEADSGRTACPLVRDLIQKRLEETERQFQEVLKLRQKMNSALASWNDMEDKLPSPHMVCHLIGLFDNDQDSTNPQAGNKNDE